MDGRGSRIVRAGVLAALAALLVFVSGCANDPPQSPLNPSTTASDGSSHPARTNEISSNASASLPSGCEEHLGDGDARPVWNATISEVVLSDASVAIGAGNVLVGSRAGVSAFDLTTGRQVWRNDLPRPENFLINEQSHLVVAFGGWGVWALDGASGQLLWSNSTIPARQVALSTDGRSLVVAARNLTMFDATTGDVRWAQPWLSDEAPVAGPVGFHHGDRRVFAYLRFGYGPTFRLASFDSANGSLAWNVTSSLDSARPSEESAPYMQSFALDGDRLLLAGVIARSSVSQGRQSVAMVSQEVSLVNGSLLPLRTYWQGVMGTYIYGSLALRKVGDDIRLAYPGDNNSLRVVSAGDGAMLWNTTIPEFANFIIDDRAERVIMANTISAAPSSNGSRNWAGFVALAGQGDEAWCSLIEQASQGQPALAFDDGVLVDVRRSVVNGGSGWIVRAFTPSS